MTSLPTPPPALSPDTDLLSVQNWLQNFIVDPTNDDEVDEREAAQALRLIKPSQTLTSLERANVYRGMYMLRMEEALGNDFPGVKHFLGDHGFWHFVYRYVQEYPSRSYNMSRLSDNVPNFLVRSTEFKRPGFLYELALLEHTIGDVFEAGASPPLTQEQVAAVPESSWATAVVRPIASLKLVKFNYPVNDYLIAMHNGKPPGSMRRHHNWLVVWRNQKYNMWRMTLSEPEYHLLDDIIQGRQLGEALVRATAGRHRMDAQAVFACFSRWVAEGFFSAVEWRKPVV